MSTAAAAKKPAAILRTAAGEPPLGIGGLAFRDDQGEMIEHDNPRYRTPAALVGVLELEDGKWLSRRLGFRVDGQRYDSRETALADSIDAVVTKARQYMGSKDVGEGTVWTEAFGNSVISWALSLQPAKEDKPVQAATVDAEAPIDHPGSENAADDADRVIEDQASGEAGNLKRPTDTDPIVRSLVEANRARKTYPAGHTFSMTNPIVNGHMVTMGRCTCGETFSYAWGSYERMDAAIEAHRQKFDHLPDKVDGMGHPIGAEALPAKPKRPRKRKEPDAPEGILASIVADAGTPTALRSEPAPFVPPGGAGLPLSDDEDAVRRTGLRILKSGESPSSDVVRDLVGIGYVHATATKLIVTEEGEAFLQQGAPIGAASEPVDWDGIWDRMETDLRIGPSEADAKCVTCEPAQICASSDEYLAGIMARTGRVDDLGSVQDALKMSSDGLTSPEPVAADQQAAATAPANVDYDSWLLRAATDLAWREPPTVTEIQRALLDFSKVYGVGREVDRPVMRWHGGKWILAPWIITHFPSHRIYVEPFGGGGSVLLRKPRCYAEVWNDLDDAIVNLFQVLRSPRAYELVEHLRLTPFARSEFDETSGPWPTDPVERARHLIIRGFMGFGSNAHGRSTGFRANSNRSGTTPAHDWANYPDSLLAIIERLSGVVIENRDACKIMETHDSAETLHYVDPPYMWETRGDESPDYTHEMDNAAHAALLEFLPSLKGMVVLSGYPHPTYDNALSGWRRIEREALADGARPRTEVLWLNPACAAALDQQMPQLFDLASFDAVNTRPPPHGLSGGD